MTPQTVRPVTSPKPSIDPRPTTRRALVVEQRTPLEALLGLREAWLEDELELHVSKSGQLLGQLARRPWLAASGMLDTSVLVAERLGMDGIVPVALTCLSAAWVLAPSEAAKAADRFVLALQTPREHLKLHGRGIHLFLDLGQIAEEAGRTALLAALAARDDRPWAIEGRPDPLDGAAATSGKALLASLAKKGALFSSALLSAVGGGKAHGELAAIVGNRPDANQALPGFGPLVRKASSDDPWFEWKEPGVGHVSAGSKPGGARNLIKTVAQLSGGSTTVTVTENGTKTQYQVTVAGDKVHYTRSGVGSEGPTDSPNAVEFTYPSPASDAPNGDHAKMPLPDDVGGDDFPAVLSDLASKGQAPWIQPLDNASGGGPAVLHYSVPSAIDPGSEAASRAPLTDDEVEKMLRFVQAKLFDSVVNPIAF